MNGVDENHSEYGKCGTSDPLEAFARLAEAANGRWDGVDVDKYVEELRSWDGLMPHETFLEMEKACDRQDGINVSTPYGKKSGLA